MSNITESYRKPLMTDETGKAIANKLGGNSNASQGYNTSEFYRKPLMTDETAQEILAKIDGGGSGDSGVSVFEALYDGAEDNYTSFAFTNSVTAKDIIDVIKDGKEAILKLQYAENSNDRVYLRYVGYNNSTQAYSFEYISGSKDGNMLSNCFVRLYEDEGSATGFRIYGGVIKGIIPDANSDSNGKILKVVNGKWAKANETIELPVVTSDDNGKILKVVDGVWTAVLPE
jgi:hypothetical protein